MAETDPLEADEGQSTPPLNPLHYLDPNSYTRRRLVRILNAIFTDPQQHATPEHLHLTTRRCFIGPTPEGWLSRHRRDWYKRHLHIHYSHRASSFSAAEDTGNHRRLTGLDTPGKVRPSFPQPQELAEGEDDSDDDNAEATLEDPPAIPVPRATEDTDKVPASPAIHFTLGTKSSLKSMTDSASKNVESFKSRKAGQGVAKAKVSFPSSVPAEQFDNDGAKPPPVLKPRVQIQEAEPSDSPDAAPANESRPSLGALRPVPSHQTGRQSTRSINSWFSRRTSDDSFVTARSRPVPTPQQSYRNVTPIAMDAQGDEFPQGPRLSVAGPSTLGAPSSNSSTTALVPVQSPKDIEQEDADPPKSLTPKKKRVTLPPEDADGEQKRHVSTAESTKTNGSVRFDLEDTVNDALLKQKLVQNRRRDTFKRLYKGKKPTGEIIKMEKMLVRVDFTVNSLPEDFNENHGEKADWRNLSKWREYMVVCRESTTDEADFMLQFYKTRVIPATERTHTKKRSTHQILLNKKTSHINVFSSLDKTIVIWEPWKRGTLVCIMRPRSGANSMEWFTFLRNLLGSKRTNMLQINVPDLSVSLRIDHPFDSLAQSENLAKAVQGDREALQLTLKEEEAVAVNIIERCCEMLERSPEWGSLIEEWALPVLKKPEDKGLHRVVTSHGVHTFSADGEHHVEPSKRRSIAMQNGHMPIGLAWKRYDRLEWVHGANEKNMWGSISMANAYELELRPKQHYPNSVRVSKDEVLIEPPPIEGFLIRLTSQKGMEQKLGKLFFKRLYFSTHNQYLVFNRPAHADPPPPPKLPMCQSGQIPSADQIREKTPLIYAINPFPLDEDQVEWLRQEKITSRDNVRKFDEDAYDESQRKVRLLLKCDGLISLTNVEAVRNMQFGASPVDDDIDEGSDVDFDQSVPNTRMEDGATGEVEEDRTFEILLKNGLVVRLQAYNKATKREWIRRLKSLVEYWKKRIAADNALYKATRERNLEALKIDEQMEAYIGQHAEKWEVSQSYASPELYHMCGLGSCRSVQMAGALFRKPHLHSTFRRSLVVLSHGHLLVFQDTLRARSGRVVAHIHHERMTAIDLSDCYVYSGLITVNDLVSSAGDGYEKSRPGQQGGLPRMYPEDKWSSTDVDSSLCFVLWHGRHKSWFRSAQTDTTEHGHGHGHGHGPMHLQHRNAEDGSDGGAGHSSSRSRLKLVGQLGKEGRSVVFKARSRAERDHWVLSVANEIERLAHAEDVRIVGK